MGLKVTCKKLRIVSKLLMIFAVIALTPCFVSAYSVSYDYFVRALNDTNTNLAITTPDQVILEGVSSTSGSITQIGTGNSATIQYYADLATGAIRAYAHAQSNRLYACGNVEKIGFSDTLTFLVPAGYYADDLTVTLSGAITGTLSATEIANAQVGYYISFAGNLFMTSPPYYAGTMDTEINDPFALTRTLVSAGTSLTSDTYFSYDLTASLNRASASTNTQYNAPYYYTEAEVDFYNTLQFTDMVVPDGVTWTSESEVFLRDSSSPTSVPESATAALLGFGIIGLVGVRKRLSIVS